MPDGPVPDGNSLLAFRAGRSLGAFLEFNDRQQMDATYRIVRAPWKRNPMAFLNSGRRRFPAGRFFPPWLKKRNWNVDYACVAQVASRSPTIDSALRVLWLRLITDPRQPAVGAIVAAVVELSRVALGDRALTPVQFATLARDFDLPPTEGLLTEPRCTETWRGRLRALRPRDSSHYLTPNKILAIVRTTLRRRLCDDLLALDSPIDHFILNSFENWQRYRTSHRSQVESASWVDGKRTRVSRKTILLKEDHERWTAMIRAGFLRPGIIL